MDFTIGIITASDKGFQGEREDQSGRVIQELAEEAGFQVAAYKILPDETEELKNEMLRQCDQLKVSLLLTTGGTGFSVRDCTPEATREVIEREVPGIAEALRAYSMQITKRAMLGRGVSGIRNQTLIVNLPGSPKAVRESLEFILPELEHGLKILCGKESECARK